MSTNNTKPEGKRVIEFIKEIPLEAQSKIYNYIGVWPDSDETLDELNEIVESREIAIARCLPYEENLNEPFEYWYNVIKS